MENLYQVFFSVRFYDHESSACISSYECQVLCSAFSESDARSKSFHHLRDNLPFDDLEFVDIVPTSVRLIYSSYLIP